jgi:hypothetical protein
VIVGKLRPDGNDRAIQPGIDRSILVHSTHFSVDDDVRFNPLWFNFRTILYESAPDKTLKIAYNQLFPIHQLR